MTAVFGTCDKCLQPKMPNCNGRTTAIGGVGHGHSFVKCPQLMALENATICGDPDCPECDGTELVIIVPGTEDQGKKETGGSSGD